MLLSQREGQVFRFPTWVMVGVPLAAILFQVYVPLFFPILSFVEMPLLVLVYLALSRKIPFPKIRWGCSAFARHWWDTLPLRWACGSMSIKPSSACCFRFSFISFISSCIG
jgi:hypothetical protein